MKYSNRIGCWALRLIAIASLAIAAFPCAGQATTGQIAGVVTDPTGAVVAHASITVTDEDKGVTFSGRSDATGNYVVLNLPPGSYSVSALASGFGPTLMAHVVVAIDQHVGLNFGLKVGTAASSVTVTEAPPILQTQSTEVGTVISGNAITDLPLLDRQFYGLANLVPGVNLGNSSMNSFNLSVGGQRSYSNSVQLDGIESTTNRTQDITITPNVDTVQEFKVETSSFSAEFGNASGGVVAVQTKSGTNALHGDAFGFFRPPYMAARQDVPGGSAVQPEATLRRNDFGGTLSGPIKRDRSFLFGGYEGTRLHDTWNYVTSTIPFGLFNVKPNGDVDFSNLVDPRSGQPGGPAAGTVDPIFDPNYQVATYGWGEQQFQGNVIPASRVSPAGMNTMLHFFPKPNLPGIDNGWFRNFQARVPVGTDTNQVDTRLDQVITPNDHLYAVYHWQNLNILDNDAFYGQTGIVPGAGDADQANNEHETAQSLSLTYDHIISPTMLNEVRFGYMHYGQDQYSLLNGTDYSTKYGFGNVAIPNFPATIGFPDIYMADGYMAGGSSYKPYHILDQNYEINESYTWTGMARHEFKAGAQIRLLHSNPNFSYFPTGYQYYGSFGSAMTSANAFWGMGCADPSWCVNNGYNWLGGSDIADLALGLPLDVYMGLQLTNPQTQSWNMAYYAQDTYKITPQLTMNYGIRWEYQNPWTESHNYMSNFDVASGNIVLAGRNGVPNGIINSRKDDISPRMGFAYAVNPKTVVRVGGGIYFSPENDGREDFMTKNNPFAQQQSFTNWEWDVAPTTPQQVWPYQDDAGSPRSTAINIPTAGFIQPKNLVNGTLETTYAVNPKLKTGTSGSYNLTLERQLGRTLSLNVSYVGSMARHLSYQIGDINASPTQTTSSVTGNKTYDYLITPYLGAIQYLTDVGNSSYNALQVKLAQQTSPNTSFLISYTYSHNLDNGPAPFDMGNNNDRPQNPYNLSAERASSDSDMRHNLVVSGDYKLPFGKGQQFGSTANPIIDGVLGGWKLSGVIIMHTGTPVNVIQGQDPKSSLSGLRPNVTGNPNLSHGKRNFLEYFNTAAFSMPTIPQGSNYAYGNAGRNIVVGPGYINEDLSLIKDFSVENRWTLQVRAETFNSTNSVHYNNPDGNMTDGTFGSITSTQSPRVGQLAVKILF